MRGNWFFGLLLCSLSFCPCVLYDIHLSMCLVLGLNSRLWTRARQSQPLEWFFLNTTNKTTLRQKSWWQGIGMSCVELQNSLSGVNPLHHFPSYEWWDPHDLDLVRPPQTPGAISTSPLGPRGFLWVSGNLELFTLRKVKCRNSTKVWDFRIDRSPRCSPALAPHQRRRMEVLKSEVTCIRSHG